jgi:PAS domain S-box-containing protein
MLDSNLHRLLRRQIKNSGLESDDISKYEKFLELVNDAYNSFDVDLNHVENILEESSKELFIANKLIKKKYKNVESQLNNIVNTIDGVIFQTDLEGNFIYLNSAWAELTGLRIEDSINKNFGDLIPGMNPKDKARLNLFLRQSQKEFKSVLKYTRSNNSIIWIELRLILTLDESNNASGTIGTLMDITNLKETEIELKKANKTKDEFMSTMSHEIRTPMNAVIGMTEILLMDKYLPNQLENLQALKYSGEHLMALINNLLDLNKIHSEKMNLANDQFNLIETLQNISIGFNYSAKDKPIVFRTVINKNVPQMVFGDSLKLSQVLKNLLSNAFKFTDRGFITLSVEALNKNKNEASIRFAVRDSGIGILKHKQEEIFKSFVQANSSTSRLYGGTGLGLSISRELLLLQNSEMHIESQKGTGSRFYFDITYQLKNDQIQTSTLKRHKIEIVPINLKVLVAEDNNLNILVLRKLFERWQVDYTITMNGEELLKAHEENDYDLILMDLQMPILDGYETAKKIRKLDDSTKSKIPIIALTAFAQAEIRDKTKRYKMDGYMSKPFAPSELYDILKFYSRDQLDVG